MSQTGKKTETAYAKLNLALHVRRRERDGYHAIETIFVFAEDGDVLEAEPADALTLEVTGAFADAIEGGNLVLTAAERLRAAFGVREGARLRLDKCLPVAAGIGGGSADAAAALRLLARLWGVDAADPRLADIARGIGADVPACLTSVSALGTGRGDELRPMATGHEGVALLLVNPRLPLTTGPVFRGWDGADRGPLDPAAPNGWRNDLEAPARALVPAIGTVLARLTAQPGVTIARMSGSGATCFALFEAAAARDAAMAAMDGGWWKLASRVR